MTPVHGNPPSSGVGKGRRMMRGKNPASKDKIVKIRKPEARVARNMAAQA